MFNIGPNQLVPIIGISQHALNNRSNIQNLATTQLKGRGKKKVHKKVFKIKEEHIYRGIVVTMATGIDLVATWSSNPASSSVMVASVKTHKRKRNV